MPAKAVYASGVLAIYISRRQLDELLKRGSLRAGVWILKTEISGAELQVNLEPAAHAAVLAAHNAYQGALKAGSLKWSRGVAGRFGPGPHPNTQQGGSNEGA